MEIVDLFLISLFILFLELACIRWFPAHVLFLTFFSNTVLLACFLGMSVGCFRAGSSQDYFCLTPALLGIAIGSAFALESLMFSHGQMKFVDVGQESSAQVVYFGTERKTQDLATFRIPVELINGYVFLVITLTFIGPGQYLGRLLARVPDRVQAYTINIAGSIVGILSFAAVSALHLSPFWWFLPAVIGMAYFMVRSPSAGRPVIQWASRLLLVCVLFAVSQHAGNATLPAEDGGEMHVQYLWSPYYRVDYVEEPYRWIHVNLIGHQLMNPAKHPGQAYILPHSLNRDSGGARFKNVLVIGAGSGNDVSNALLWGAEHVDAVEIDPVIYELGKAHHPDHPYDDPRVTVHLDDGRNFLRATREKYDLVIYALVDSLVLHSSYSNIRLESYLFTRQAFEDVKGCLAPRGVFVMSNYYRQGWIVSRLSRGIEDVFGTPPLVLRLPYRPEIGPDENFGVASFTLILSGDTGRIRQEFARHPRYWLSNTSLDPVTAANGFTLTPPAGSEESWTRYGIARVRQPTEPLRPTTDDWPFLYLRAPFIPDLTTRGMVLMGGAAAVILLAFRPRGGGAVEDGRLGLNARMFFLGAGFMLVETKAVVHLALLFGGTWVVNSVVFFAVLVMILVANLYVIARRPTTLAPYYTGLLIMLVLNVLVPIESFLGMDRVTQAGLSCLLVFTPVLFAGVIFAVSFARTGHPDQAFGYNVAGAMLGGLAENLSMVLGFRHLLLVAIGFYLVSLVVGLKRTARATPERELTPAVSAAV